MTVNTLQSHLHELSDEASNPSSLVHRCNKGQRDELKVLIKSCKSDLKDLEKALGQYNSLKTGDPRMRDKFGFSADKQTEMRVKLSTHADRLNLFLTHLNSGALGRIESAQESHSHAFGEIQAKLNSIHEDVRRGRKDPALLSSMEDWGALERELIDDAITEVDVELNKDMIQVWLQQMQAEDGITDKQDTSMGRKRGPYKATVEDAAEEDDADHVFINGEAVNRPDDSDSDDTQSSAGSELSTNSTVLLANPNLSGGGGRDSTPPSSPSQPDITPEPRSEEVPGSSNEQKSNEFKDSGDNRAETWQKPSTGRELLHEKTNTNETTRSTT